MNRWSIGNRWLMNCQSKEICNIHTKDKFILEIIGNKKKITDGFGGDNFYEYPSTIIENLSGNKGENISPDIFTTK